MGQGGGVTGKATQYQIFRDGKVLKGTGMIDIKYSASGKISKCLAKKYFKKFESLSEPSFSEPGNIYYYISLIKNDKEKKYTWGKPGYTVSDTIFGLYAEMNKKITGLEFIPVKN